MDSDILLRINNYCSCLHEWNASYEEYAKSVGLSFTSLSILSAIAEMESCTQKKLCESLFYPKQTVNAVITAFYKKGWITMRELPEDRRNKTIHFTEKGQLEAHRILQRVHASEQTAMRELNGDEQALLITLTQRYVAACKNAIKGF